MASPDPSNSYLEIVKDHLHKLGDDLLAEDLDLVCKYVVLRFLKTSPDVYEGLGIEEVEAYLHDFIRSIYPFLATFVMIVNSPSLANRSHA